MRTLLFSSRSRVDWADRWEVLNNIETVSIARNSVLGITGLLIVTPNYFAQWIEGSQSGIDLVMPGIRCDKRHDDLRVLREGKQDERRFRTWRMARFERSEFGISSIEPILAAVHADPDAVAMARLERLFETLDPGHPLPRRSKMVHRTPIAP